MLATERLQLFDSRQPHWSSLDGIEPYTIALRGLQPHLAESLFLIRFEDLISLHKEKPNA
jgi:hypothetical protein